MSSIQPIARVHTRELGNFVRDFVAHERPVIITDLYRGSRIVELDGIDKVRGELGHVPIHISRNYYDAYLSGEASPRQLTNVNRYLQLVGQQPDTELMCTEQRMPPAFRRLIELPELARCGRPSRPVGMIYLANRGTTAPLHFDNDQREVLFTQVLGRKRVFLIEPRFGARLSSIGGLSGIPVHRFEEAEKQRFFAANLAWSCTLAPGETLYVPKLWWHYLENLEVTMAYGIRAGLTAATRRLRLLPYNFLTQNISRRLVDPADGRARDPAAIDGLLRAYFRWQPTREQRLLAAEEALAAAYRRLCPDAPTQAYLPEWFTRALRPDGARAQWLGYREPVILARGDLSKATGAVAGRRVARIVAEAKVSKSAVERVRRGLGLTGRGAMTLFDSTLLANALTRADTLAADA